MTDNHYVTRFGSLNAYERGRVESIADDVRHYALSNCFEIASQSRPWEKVVCGQNQIYVLETIRTEGESPWFTCAHDEFLLSMDGEMDVNLIALEGKQIVADADKMVTVLVNGPPQGKKMGWMKLRRGHQALLPKNTAYQIRSAKPGVAILQTCKGELSVERWADICQMA